MLYLCAKYDKEEKLSYPYDSPRYWEVVEWLVWMQSGIGPIQVYLVVLNILPHFVLPVGT